MKTPGSTPFPEVCYSLNSSAIKMANFSVLGSPKLVHQYLWFLLGFPWTNNKPSTVGNDLALTKAAISLVVREDKGNTWTDPAKLKFSVIPSMLFLPFLVILLMLYLYILEPCLKVIKLPQCCVAAESQICDFMQFSGKVLWPSDILLVHCVSRGKG